MKKRLIASVTCVCLLLIMLLSSTLAWFTDQTEATKSTMTVGNVEIQQLEQYREYQDDGSFILRPWHMAESSYPANLYPAVHLGSEAPVGEPIPINGKGDYYLFNQDQNVIDKIVSVMNVGSDPAYVRTVYAFEMMWDGLDWVNPIGDEVMLNCNEMQSIIFPKTADGKDIIIYRPDENGSDDAAFVIGVATYGEALDSAQISAPSLLQFYLAQNVVEDDAFRTSVGGAYEILVLSQAVQTAGFGEYGAAIALDAAFGPVNAQNAAAWFGEEYEGASVHTITDLATLKNAFITGGQGFIENMEISGVQETLAADKTLRLDMNKSVLNGTDENYAIINYGTLQIYGDGTIVNNMKGSIENWGILYVNKLNIDVKGTKYGFHCKGGEVEINDLVLTAERGGLNVQGGDVTVNSCDITFSGCYDNENKKWLSGYLVYAGGETSDVVINGGEFFYIGTNAKQRVICAEYGAKVTINGGTFGKGGKNVSSTWLLEREGGDIIIYGGTFQFDPSDFVAKDEGYQAVQGEDGWWTVSKIEG